MAGSDGNARPMCGAAGAIRSNSSLIAGPEKRLMLSIAARLPNAVTPNHMTALGAFGGLMCAAGYLLSGIDWRFLFLSIAGFVVHWLGDGLDGNLARLRRIERPNFGAFLDQTADVFAIGLTILGVGLSPYVRLDVALFAAIPYLLLVLLRQMRAHVTGIDEIAHGGIGGTEGRIIMVVMTGAMMKSGPGYSPFFPSVFSNFDLAFLAMGAWGIFAFATGSVAVLKKLAAIDPPRIPASPGTRQGETATGDNGPG